MRHRWKLGVLLTAGALLAMALTLAVGSARADNPYVNVVDVTCTDGQSYGFALLGPPFSMNAPSNVAVVPGPGRFSIHEITFIPHDGSDSFSIKNLDGVAQNQELVTCTHVGVNFDFAFTGFFIPAG